MQKQPETPSGIIKAARDKSDLTVEELTDRVGITERYLYRIENEVEDLVRMLYSCDDRSLKIIRATVKAALESQTENE